MKRKTNENGAALVTIIILVLLIIISIEVAVFFHAKKQKEEELSKAKLEAESSLTVGEAQDEEEDTSKEDKDTNKVSIVDTKVKNEVEDEVKNEVKDENTSKDTNTTKTSSKKKSGSGKELNYVETDVIELIHVYSDDEYDVYTYGGTVTLNDGTNETPLKDALESGDLKISTIIKKVKSDAQSKNCRTDFYSDGGSTEYIYKDVTILVTNRLLEEKHSIVFGIASHGAAGILNQFERLLEHKYTGSEYEKGLGEQATLLHKAYDNLWIIDDGRKAMFYVKDDTEIVGNIEEGDKINIVYSGIDKVDMNNRFYEYSKYTKNGGDYIPTSINYYKNKPSNEEVIEKKLVKKLGDRLWVIDDPTPTDYSKGWVYIKDASNIIGEIKEGDSFYITSGTVAMSGTGYVELKDIYKIEKAE